MKTTKSRLIGIGICIVVIAFGGAANVPAIATIGLLGTVFIALLGVIDPVKKKKKED